MTRQLAVFACGVLFAAGLALGGMTQPARILGFLDFTGHWDPTLLAVMGGALVPYFFVARIARRRAKPLLAERFHWPTPTRLDLPLVAGSAIFGVGWGLSGYCPGPGVVSLVTGFAQPILLVLGMVAGFLLHDFFFRERFRENRPPAQAARPKPRASAVAPAEGDG